MLSIYIFSGTREGANILRLRKHSFVPYSMVSRWRKMPGGVQHEHGQDTTVVEILKI